MTEDKFEEFLQKEAQSYNVPPARTPRDDMWSAIQAQRASGPRVVYGGGLPARESSVRRFGSKVWLGAAAAAVLFLVTGVRIVHCFSRSTLDERRSRGRCRSWIPESDGGFRDGGIVAGRGGWERS